MEDVLVDRPEEAQEISAIIQTIVSDERTRRRRQTLLTVAPWAISFVFGMFAIGAGVVVARRPIPKPEMYVSIYRSDGSVEAPVERGQLSMDRKRFIIRADLQQFIIAWEDYAWQANQAYYNHVSVMTTGTSLQGRYQQSWRERGRANRDNAYGANVTRNIVQIFTSFVPGAPFALSSRMLIKVTTPTGSTCEWWAGSLTFKQDHNVIPIAEQLAYDASDVIVLTYNSNPADPNAKPFPC